ncbi:hypothetical protein IAG41_21255 [Sphingomonas sp. JC676]|uniref:hypothetical protein n=1 Tax=Sphingomonas sp. JC676 TaxID=2768065 RepID=UPI0016583DB5|nr:hypothetical protein [Sphingomonas sp. JC676]MBC9034927.1 hypothetical protein [Sphingomonas sp. JC676]
MTPGPLSPLTAQHGPRDLLLLSGITLILGILAPIFAVEAEKLLLPPAGNPRIYKYFGLPNFAVLSAFALMLGAILNFVEITGRIRGIAVLEFVAVWWAYSKVRGTR